jgi:hypothetical protein
MDNLKSIVAFTYYLHHTPTGKKYYGVRFKKGCKVEDLWTVYFSSSIIVKQLIKEYGKDSFTYEIRKTFSSTAAARKWENKVQRRLHVDTRLDWINRHIQGEQFHCICHSDKTKLKISLAMKGRIMTETHKKRMSEKALIVNENRRNTGWKMPKDAVEKSRQYHLGRPRSPETIEKIKKSKQGTVRKYLPDGSFIMIKPDHIDQ